jgi:hypothetical protein
MIIALPISEGKKLLKEEKTITDMNSKIGNLNDKCIRS